MENEIIKWNDDTLTEAQFLGTHINSNARPCRLYYANGTVYKTGTDLIIFDEMPLVHFLNSDPHESEDTGFGGKQTDTLNEFAGMHLVEEEPDSIEVTDDPEDEIIDHSQFLVEEFDDEYPNEEGLPMFNIYHVKNLTGMTDQNAEMVHVATILAHSVNDAYLRTQNNDSTPNWSNRGIRSTSIGDFIGDYENLWMVGSSEFVLVENKLEERV